MTRKLLLIAGVATFALTAPAGAQRPDNGDRGNQRAERSERPQRAERQERHQQRIERQRPQRAERQGVARAERQHVKVGERRAEQRREHLRSERRAERRVERRDIDRRRIERRAEQDVMTRNRRADRRFDRDDRRFDRDDRRFDYANRHITPQGLPHLLDRHDMRPMEEVKYKDRVRIGQRIATASAFAPVPLYYQARYRDTPDYYYRYDDDYGTMYRINRHNHFVSAMIPLFGGYNVGDPFPMAYRSSYVPLAYQPYYYDDPDYYYRYDGNAIYRIDAGTQLISGIVALLMGNQLGVGQTLPMSYNTYNVPLAYRSTYYDRDDAWYRYGDGSIYQIDPYSRRIEATYPLYGGYDDYLIGQRWPVAYPDYNVPYAYRDAYYDTPEWQYRYANNSIYRIDPTTQLISAIVALVSGNSSQFSIGQPLPAGYGVYNVPLSYRDRYYDNGDSLYRYNDGFVYRVDTRSGLIEDMYSVYV